MFTRKIETHLEIKCAPESVVGTEWVLSLSPYIPYQSSIKIKYLKHSNIL